MFEDDSTFGKLAGGARMPAHQCFILISILYTTTCKYSCVVSGVVLYESVTSVLPAPPKVKSLHYGEEFLHI